MTPPTAVRDAKQPSSESLRSPPRKRMGREGKCLLVSSDSKVLDGMGRAAVMAGWDCFPCSSPEESLRQAFLERYSLGIVDVEPAEHRRELKDLFRLLGDSASGLVIACDRSGDAATELWARESGVWLYVPGVADWSELSTACFEAKRVFEKRGNRDSLGSPA